MKNLIYLFLLFISSAGYSQSFKPVTANSKVNLYYSESVDQSIRGFRVDTVIKGGGFEVLKFHKEFNDDWNCPKPFSASWLGEKCIIDTTKQIAYFFNEVNDTLILHYSKQVGFEWNFYKKGSVTIKAKIIGVNIETLLNGKEQAVKSIQLYKYNLSGKDEWEKYNTRLKISENSGFTQLIGFKSLPELYENKYGSSLLQFKLIPNRIIKLSDIYNYNVGDLFEYSVRDINNLTDYHLIEVLNKFSDTKYLLKHTYQHNTAFLDKPTEHKINITIDTFKILKNDTMLDASKILPMETSYAKFGSKLIIYDDVFFYDNLFYFPPGTVVPLTKPITDTCWKRMFWEGGGGPFEYKEGYGYFIRSYEEDGGKYLESEKMIFSKKGNKITGTFIPLGLDEIKPGTTFSIHPNPSSNTIFINSGNLKIEGYKVRSVNGQVLMEASDYNKNEGVDISNLSKGLYFINIQSSEGNSTMRFLKTENK